MLGSIMKKLKTEKNNEHSKQHDPSVSEISKQDNIINIQELYSNINNYDILKNCPQINMIQNLCDAQLPFPKIRYFLLKDLPNIGPLVRNCKFSKFHHLTHSQRKVKQIKLKIKMHMQVNQTNQNEINQIYPMPQYLKFLQPLLDIQIPTYNHILINDYPPGIGIMPHTDGPAYHNKVFVLSLESYCIIQFKKSLNDSENDTYSVLLEPNSIHIFQQKAYLDYLHGIEDKIFDLFYLFYDEDSKKVIKSCKYRLFQALKSMQGQQMKLDEIKGAKLIKTDTTIDQYHYNYAVKLKRRQRISITIRQKY